MSSYMCLLSASTRHIVHSPLTLTHDAGLVRFRDELQVPLQPLGHQLENATYEVFEKDPVKYRNYRLAVEQMLITMRNKVLAKGMGQFETPRCSNNHICAVHDGIESTDNRQHAQSSSLPLQQQSSSSSSSSSSSAIVIKVCVLGAGRGPLVQCCIEASHNTGIAIELSALEKNPFALCTLRQRVQMAGGRCDGVCHTIMLAAIMAIVMMMMMMMMMMMTIVVVRLTNAPTGPTCVSFRVICGPSLRATRSCCCVLVTSGSTTTTTTMTATTTTTTTTTPTLALTLTLKALSFTTLL
jgi:hypothetical protein